MSRPLRAGAGFISGLYGILLVGPAQAAAAATWLTEAFDVDGVVGNRCSTAIDSSGKPQIG